MRPLVEELAIWRDRGLVLPIWWRDDDAVEPTPALDRLLALAMRFAAPLHLAVVPEYATDALADRLRQSPTVSVLPHGLAHRNHAPPTQKKAEFSAHRPLPEMMDDIDRGWRRLRSMFAEQALPIFTPPWNRIAAEVAERLPSLGLWAISTYGPRKSVFAAKDLPQVNTHVDPIDWHGGGGLIDEDALAEGIALLLAERRAGRADRDEPFGLLTHHLVHREDVWSFTERFLLTMGGSGVARWTSPLPR